MLNDVDEDDSWNLLKIYTAWHLAKDTLQLDPPLSQRKQQIKVSWPEKHLHQISRINVKWLEAAIHCHPVIWKNECKDGDDDDFFILFINFPRNMTSSQIFLTKITICLLRGGNERWNTHIVHLSSFL